MSHFHTDVKLLVDLVNDLDKATVDPDMLDSDLIALEMLQGARKSLMDIEKELSTAIGNAMGEKRRIVPEAGMYERTPRRESTKCIDEEGLWRYVVDSRMVDPDTGEVLPIHEVIRLVYGAESQETGKVRVTGATSTKVEAVGIDPDDFFERGEWLGWTIKRK